MSNVVVELAKTRGRDYITPEDVSDAIRAGNVPEVRRDVLEVIAKCAGAGAEDASLCAYIAWRGTPTPESD